MVYKHVLQRCLPAAFDLWFVISPFAGQKLPICTVIWNAPHILPETSYKRCARAYTGCACSFSHVGCNQRLQDQDLMAIEQGLWCSDRIFAVWPSVSVLSGQALHAVSMLANGTHTTVRGNHLQHCPASTAQQAMQVLSKILSKIIAMVLPCGCSMWHALVVDTKFV